MPEETVRASLTTPLRFHPLSYLDEGGPEVTVGRVDNGTFVILPADAARLLQRLEAGDTGDQALRWYREEYGEELDLADFIDELHGLGFLLDAGEEAAAPVLPRWHTLACWTFSPVAAACYLLLLSVAGWFMATTPSLVPRPKDVVFTHYLTLAVLALFIGQLPLIALHEAAHAVAGRRLGLPTRVSLGRRLYYVVFETNLDGLVSVPRRKRYLPMLAGMIADAGSIACLTALAKCVQHEHLPAVCWKFLLALSYLTVVRIGWQLWIFLQTDIYHLAATAQGCIDLHTTAKQILRNRFDAVRGRPPSHDPEQWHPRDRAAAGWYSWVLAAGYLLCPVSIVIGLIPTLARMVYLVNTRLTQPHHRTPAGVLDALVFFVLAFGELLIAAWLAVRERRRSRRNPAFPAPTPLPAVSANAGGWPAATGQVVTWVE